jgi:hypothetical protein
MEGAMDVLRGYREFCKTSPDELTVWAVLRGAPPLPFLDADEYRNYSNKLIFLFVICLF